jgi:hypothetical protein
MSDDQDNPRPFGVFKPPRGVVGKDGKITRPPFEGFDSLLSAATSGECFFFSGGGGDVCGVNDYGCTTRYLTMGPQIGQVDLKGNTELWFFFQKDRSTCRGDGEWLCIFCPTSALLAGGIVQPLSKYPPNFTAIDARRVCERLQGRYIGSADYWNDLRLLFFMSIFYANELCATVSRLLFFRFASREVSAAETMLSMHVNSVGRDVDDYLRSAVIKISMPVLSRSLHAISEGRKPEIEIDLSWSPRELIDLCKRMLRVVTTAEDRKPWLEILRDIAEATAPDDVAPDPSSLKT